MVRELAGDPKEHLSKSGPAAHCVMPFGGFGINPTVMFLSPDYPLTPALRHT